MQNRAKTSLSILLFMVIGLLNSVAQNKNFTLQIEAVDHQATALLRIKQLKASGVDAYYLQSLVPGKGTLHRVRVGSFADLNAAKESGEALLRSRLIKEYFITRHEGGSQATMPSGATADSSLIKSDSILTGNEPPTSEKTAKPPLAVSTDIRHASSVTSRSSESPLNKGGHQFGDESGWEIYLAGGGSFWSHQDTMLSFNDLLKITPDPALGPLANKQFRIRQSFASGGRLVMGLVKNINNHAALEFSYTYGANNFKLTAQEDIVLDGYRLAPKGFGRSLSMRSHIAGINYRHSFVNNEQARIYLTGGFNLTVFRPTNDGLDKLFGFTPSDLSDFKQKPNFKTVAAPGVNFGAGVILKVHENVGLRFDVRDYMTFTKRVKGSAELNSGDKLEVSLFGNTLHNLVPTFGVVFTQR